MDITSAALACVFAYELSVDRREKLPSGLVAALEALREASLSGSWSKAA